MKSRRYLNITGLRYNADSQDFQVRCYSVITEGGDLKYNLLYDLASGGRIKSDRRLAGLLRTLVMEIRLRDEMIDELDERIAGLEEQIEARPSELDGRNGEDRDDSFDDTGKVKNYYGA